VICTIFKNIYPNDAHYITVDDALKRIADCKSQYRVDEIRNTIDENKAAELKKNLPAICFSGKFKPTRRDSDLIEHSGFVVLDFDKIENIPDRITEIINHDFIYACWISPSGNGLKALVRIADGSKHREHFQALMDIFPDMDEKNINVSRVCFESADKNIYIYPDARIFATIKTIEKYIEKEAVGDDYDIFKKLLVWLANRNDAFVKGERNNFIFKLASACCRYGLRQDIAESYIHREFLVSSDFTKSECDRTIKSAYKANIQTFGSCIFEKSKLVNRETKVETKIDAAIYDESIRPKDVIYGIDVKDKAINIYLHGYEKLKGIGVAEIDERWKPKRGEITLLTGIGNYGKTAFKKWYQVFRSILYDEKFATFGPEDCPAEEYYHDLTEILLGCELTSYNPNKPNREIYERAYDFITQHFFYVYPETDDPTPEYILERFLELLIKEKIDGADIDPFNQLTNNYKNHAGRDKYLEYILTKFLRFSQINQIYKMIVAHPIKMAKAQDGNYPCPDVFDVADGAMWSNKMCNILVYHRPFAQIQPQNPMVEFHSKKIKRQKIVGKKGASVFDMDFSKRRFFFNGSDPMQKAINNRGLDFELKQTILKFDSEMEMWTPYKDNFDGF
jgi:hypothetical protein